MFQFMDNPFISERDAAHYLGLAEGRLRHMRKRGIGPKFYLLPNGEVRYQPNDIEQWVLDDGRITEVEIENRHNVIPFPNVKLRKKRVKLQREKLRRPGRKSQESLDEY